MGIFGYFLGYFLILDRAPPYPHSFFRAGAARWLLSRDKFQKSLGEKFPEGIVAGEHQADATRVFRNNAPYF